MSQVINNNQKICRCCGNICNADDVCCLKCGTKLNHDEQPVNNAEQSNIFVKQFPELHKASRKIKPDQSYQWADTMNVILGIVLVIFLIGNLVFGFVAGDLYDSFIVGLLSFIGSALISFVICGISMVICNISKDIAVIRKHIENNSDNSD